MTRTAALGLGACGRAEGKNALGNVRRRKDTQTFILEHLGELAFSGLAAVLGWLGKTVWDTVKEQKNMKKAIKALLHDRLYQSSHFYLKQEWVDMEGLTNVGYIYESYHDLGGNGTGTALYNKIKELPIRDS